MFIFRCSTASVLLKQNIDNLNLLNEQTQPLLNIVTTSTKNCMIMGIVLIVLCCIFGALVFRHIQDSSGSGSINKTTFFFLSILILVTIILGIIFFVFFLNDCADLSNNNQQALQILQQTNSQLNTLVSDSQAASQSIDNNYVPLLQSSLPNAITIGYANQIFQQSFELLSALATSNNVIDANIANELAILMTTIQTNLTNNDYMSFVANVSLFNSKVTTFISSINMADVFLTTITNYGSILINTNVTIANLVLVQNNISLINTILTNFQTNICTSVQSTADIVGGLNSMYTYFKSLYAPMVNINDLFTYIQNNDIGGNSQFLTLVSTLNTFVNMPNATITDVQNFFLMLEDLIHNDLGMPSVLSAISQLTSTVATLKQTLLGKANCLNSVYTILGTQITQDIINATSNLKIAIQKINPTITTIAVANAASIGSYILGKLPDYDVVMMQYANVQNLISNYANLHMTMAQIVSDYTQGMAFAKAQFGINITSFDISQVSLVAQNLLSVVSQPNSLYSLTNSNNQNCIRFLAYLDLLNITNPTNNTLNLVKVLNPSASLFSDVLAFLSNFVLTLSSSNTSADINNTITFPSYFAGVATSPGSPRFVNSSGVVVLQANDILGYLDLMDSLYKSFMIFFSTTCAGFLHNFSNITTTSSAQWTSIFSGIVTNFNNNLGNNSYLLSLSSANVSTAFVTVRQNLYNFSTLAFRAGFLTYPIGSKEQEMVLSNSSSQFLMNFQDEIFSGQNIVNLPMFYYFTNPDGSQGSLNVLSSATGMLRHNVLTYLCFSSWYQNPALTTWMTNTGKTQTHNIINQIIQPSQIVLLAAPPTL